jgi:hypothetical protein
MDSITLILILFITTNVVLVVGVMWLVRKMKLDQKRRQQKLLTLAKDKEELRQVSILQDQIIAEKDKLIDKYKQIFPL